MGRNIAQRLVAAGGTVIDVPAKLSTRVRVYSTGHGTKTDHSDAVAIARAAIHSKHLRHVQPDGPNVALKLLSDRRTELVRQRTSAVCRLHRFPRELISGGARLSTASTPGVFRAPLAGIEPATHGLGIVPCPSGWCRRIRESPWNKGFRGPVVRRVTSNPGSSAAFATQTLPKSAPPDPADGVSVAPPV
jgi:hypothetical protein